VTIRWFESAFRRAGARQSLPTMFSRFTRGLASIFRIKRSGWMNLYQGIDPYQGLMTSSSRCSQIALCNGKRHRTKSTLTLQGRES
jgi:hypothetical protein